MRALILIPAAVRDAANTAAASFDPAGGGQTFTVPLFAAGTDTIAAYWCSTEMSEEVFDQVQTLQTAFPGSVVERWDPDVSPRRPGSLLAEHGLTAEPATP
ncbi:MAG: hypothetical protein RL514_3507 [Verrucomicrobiota bacterium]|jgi:phospholipase/lecithinase/hemolysin